MFSYTTVPPRLFSSKGDPELEFFLVVQLHFVPVSTENDTPRWSID